MKVLGPTPDFPTWGSKRDWEPPGNLTFKSNGIWLQNFCRTRETDLKGTHKTVCILGPRRKEKWPHKSQTCLWVFGSLQQRHGSTVACYGVRTLTAVLEGAACWHKSFWRRSPLFLTQFGLRPNYREGTQPHSSAENWTTELLIMALPTRARSSFLHSQSLPSGSFHKSPIIIYQRADRMKTTITEN